MTADDLLSILLIALVIIVVIGIVSLIQTEASKETITIDDEIVDVDVSNDKYMRVIFKDSGTYNIDYIFHGNMIDFKGNSRLIIKLETTNLWLMPNTDNIWYIVQIIKVPD